MSDDQRTQPGKVTTEMISRTSNWTLTATGLPKIVAVTAVGAFAIAAFAHLGWLLVGWVAR